jgi:hypothetical protein
LDDWTKPVSKAIAIRDRSNHQKPESLPFVNPLPDTMTYEQANLSMKVQILCRAADNMESSRLNNIAFNFELMGLALMWYGQVSTVSVI